jgi:hypothetical protein
MRNRHSAILILIGITAGMVFTMFGGQWIQAKTNLRDSSQSGKASTTGATTANRGDTETYPYHSLLFNELIADSHRVCKPDTPENFYVWMQNAYEKSSFRFPGYEKLTLEGFLSARGRDLRAISNTSQRTEAEVRTGAWLHKEVKTVIPRFSLERGFEFCNVITYGERQCFLQSILIAGMLQRMGAHAGVVMVYKNIRGEETNNGHAVVLLKLPDGRDIIVDASDPEPFARQQGLFVRDSDYVYVDPVFDKSSDAIIYYKSASTGRRLKATRIRTLDYAFLRSQFFYYRGERAEGGVFASKQTMTGLDNSIKYLRTSIALNPKNPLAVYMLGRAYRAERNFRQSARLFRRAYSLYSEFGWVPQGTRQAYALSRRPNG